MRSNQLGIKLFAGLINSPATDSIDHTRLFGVAFLLSFLGSLPPGTTNLMTVRLVTEDGVIAAALFSAGCLLAELVTVSASLILVDRMLRFKGIAGILQWISLTVLLAFTVACFVVALNNPVYQQIVVADGASPLVLGFLIMIVNPVQLPFWLGWTTLLAERKIMRAVSKQYIIYVAGSGVGSFLASGFFILLGKLFISKWTVPPMAFYITLGILFLLSFVLQLRKILESRGVTKA
ncbi:MAG: hypothetical protein QM762_03650 [Chryseolinea sp.]